MLPAVPRVLLVDDDPTMLKLLEVNFTIEGFDVATASSGEDALALAAAAVPDAVVLDLTLPGISGKETAERLRAAPATAGAALVFLTGRAPEDADVGDVPFVAKPFDPSSLVALVRGLVEGAA
jgi:DNA-binding response OmpR family regulator